MTLNRGCLQRQVFVARLCSFFITRTGDQAFRILDMLNHTLHAALYRNLAVALHTALAKAPRHRQRLSTESYRITSF